MRECEILDANDFDSGFEEDDLLRSTFMRGLMLDHVASAPTRSAGKATMPEAIPRTIVRYWHDPDDLPEDVRTCIASWDRLQQEGVVLETFNDITARSYVEARCGSLARDAFDRCWHPAMRSDYFRLCHVLAEGGVYVDVDDVLVNGDEWRELFIGSNLKLQPLCYNVSSHGMLTVAEIWRAELPVAERIFYVNNNPLAAPAGHPVLQRAFDRATDRLLSRDRKLEIQETTGPGNLTACLVAHARELKISERPPDYELLDDWGAIAETRWQLSYRNDARNWRNVNAT